MNRDHDIVYTAADFQRYHDGTMPAGERHALERAALEDPFLSDALEGYGRASSPREDLSALRARLGRRMERRPVTRMAAMGWWRVAAAVAMILAGTALYVLFRGNHPGKPLARLTVPGTVVRQSPGDSGNAGKQHAGSQTEHPPELPTPALASADKTLPRRNKVASGLYGKNTGDQASGKGSREQKPGRNDVTQTPRETSAEYPSDSAGNRMVMGYDKQRLAPARDTPDVSGAVSAAPAADTGHLFAFSRSRSMDALSRIPESKMPGADQAAGQRDSLTDHHRFVRYLQRHPRALRDSAGNRLGGEVTLLFDTDRSGRPVHIRVVRSTCPSCNDDARALLANGPHWKRLKKDQSVTIPY